MPPVRPVRHHGGPLGASVLTPVHEGFWRVDGAIWCESVPLDRIVQDVGTPLYVYSGTAIRARYAELDAALAGLPHRIQYSVKANGNLGVLRIMREVGAGVDVVSGGELFRARRAGFDATDVIFGGVGKTPRELREALEAGVALLNVESEPELALANGIARELGVIAPIGLRVNPNVPIGDSHPYIRTGERGMKFGIPATDVVGIARRARTLAHVRLIGLDMHIGSQISRVAPYETALECLLELIDALRAEALAPDLRFIDIGGGFGVSYGDTSVDTGGADIATFARAVTPALLRTGLTALVEPGRFIVANAGLLLTRVLYRKRSGGKTIVITDAGMTDLLRPSHYQAYHRIEPLVLDATRAAQAETVDIAGPVCESGDFLALDRALPPVAPGAVLAVYSAGAYGFVMASNYNARPRCPEVLVDGSRYAVTRARERYEDLVCLEPTADEWRDGGG